MVFQLDKGDGDKHFCSNRLGEIYTFAERTYLCVSFECPIYALSGSTPAGDPVLISSFALLTRLDKSL